MKQVWMCGGGVQSAAIAALIVEGRIPKPDYAAMADTGREKSSTWRYVNDMLKPKLDAVGVDLVIIPASKYATVDLYAKNGDLLIPAFTTINGPVAKLPGFCSNEWKTRVIHRWLTEQGVSPSGYRKWIGFSANELRRVFAGNVWYPLIFEVRMFREDCLAVAEKVFGQAPPKGGSCCWMCPNMGDAQWIEMRESDPQDFESACALDEQIREADPHIFVHSSGTPLRTAELGNPNQMQLGCTGGVCFV